MIEKNGNVISNKKDYIIDKKLLDTARIIQPSTLPH